MKAKVAEVVVVLGAHADECAKALQGLAVRTVVNAGWTEGIGSSIRVGMAALGPEVDGVVIGFGRTFAGDSDSVPLMRSLVAASPRWPPATADPILGAGRGSVPRSGTTSAAGE